MASHTEHDTIGLSFSSCKINGKWVVQSFNEYDDIDRKTKADTEADARAKMLIYLLENGLLKS